MMVLAEISSVSIHCLNTILNIVENKGCIQQTDRDSKVSHGLNTMSVVVKPNALKSNCLNTTSVVLNPLNSCCLCLCSFNPSMAVAFDCLLQLISTIDDHCAFFGFFGILRLSLVFVRFLCFGIENQRNPENTKESKETKDRALKNQRNLEENNSTKTKVLKLCFGFGSKTKT